jgi:hypothetical protein
MLLFLISQRENRDYDTYDSAVVCAESEEAARQMHPNGQGAVMWGETWAFSDWCSSPDKVTVKLIGEASPDLAAGVVCASFNAG